MSGRSVLSADPEGRHQIIVATKEELSVPSKVTLPEPEPAPGLISPDGTINWGCPCLGGMATGPCGLQFRDAFSCFHYSDAEPKGSDCYEKFSVMQACMAQYPQLYGRDDDDDVLGGVGGTAGDGPAEVEGPPEGASGGDVPPADRADGDNR